jgi:NAD(P)-dependent dehydrogenase (short-subunit alcohol dehydrogenase family)
VGGSERVSEQAQARLALVNGADRGPGPRVVRLLAAHGMRVVSAGRSVQRCREALDLLGDLADRIAVRHLDHTDPASIERLVGWLRDRLGRCDVLVNVCDLPAAGGRAAAGWVGAAAGDGDPHRLAVEADLMGAYRLTRAVAPLMRAQRYGRVVNVADVADLRRVPRRRVSAQRASASAVAALTRVLAAELAPDGILVYAAPADTVVWIATLPDGGPTGVVLRRPRPDLR